MKQPSMANKQEQFNRHEQMNRHEQVKKCEQVNKREQVNEREWVNKREQLNKSERVNRQEQVNKCVQMNRHEQLNKRGQLNKCELVNRREQMNKKEWVNKCEQVIRHEQVTKRGQLNKPELVNKHKQVNKHEQVNKPELNFNTHKRQQVLEMLSDIVQKKRQSLDAEEPEATDEFLAADDAISASSSLMPETEDTLHHISLGSSTQYTRNSKSRENQVKGLVEESELDDAVNLSSLRESFAESGRNTSLPSDSKWSSHHVAENQKHSKLNKKLLPDLGCYLATSERRSQSLISRSSERKGSGDDNSLLGPARENVDDNILGTMVDTTQSQHIGKVAVLSEKKSDKQNVDFSSKYENQQFSVREAEHKLRELCSPLSLPECDDEAMQTEVDNPLSITTCKLECHCLNDEVDPFAFSPLRKVRLKFRDDTTGQRISITPDIVLSPTKPCSKSNSRSPNIDKHKQLSENSVKNYKDRTPGRRLPLLGHCPASKHCEQPLITRGSKRKLPGHDRSLLGPHPSSVPENERYVSKHCKKPLLHVDAQNREFARLDQNSYHHCRGRMSDQRTYPHHPPSKCFTDGQFKQVAERSEWLENGDDSLFEDQRTSRFKREVEFTNESSWQQRHKEASRPEREHSLRREEDEWLEREYTNRREVTFRQERVFDLRDKLNSRYRYSNRRHGDDDYSFNRGAGSPGDEQINRDDGGRRCLLRAPPYQLQSEYNEDEPHIVDDFNYDTQRRQYSSHGRDSPSHLHDELLRQDGDDMWMNVDRRQWKQSWEYNTPSLKQEPHHDWDREVRHDF